LKFIDVNTARDLDRFYKTGNEIYYQNPYYRSSEDDILRLVIEGPTQFHSHAQVYPIIVEKDDIPVCRFAFIYDSLLPDYVQVAFFEAKPGINNLAEDIINEAKIRFPDISKICFGLNGHLNYGAGILLTNFDKIPVFGLPYNLPYYKDYFSKLEARKIVSFKFPAQTSENFIRLASKIKMDKNISIRKLDKKNLLKYSEIYTKLNNRCFLEHPFWANREAVEDLELFEQFQFLMQEKNLLIAEYNGEAVGFLFWFPDFNQLLTKNRELKANSNYSLDVLRFRHFNPIDTFRFTEIGVDSRFRKKGIEMALINQMLEDVIAAGYKFGIGGFIFEENKESINMAIKYIERVSGEKVTPDSEYAVFESR
jgi:GNAT superfamily N-acetyltransferase